MAVRNYNALWAAKGRCVRLLFVLLLAGLSACNPPATGTYLSDGCAVDTVRKAPVLQADTVNKNTLPRAFTVQYPDSLGTPNLDIPFKRVDSVWAFVTNKKHVVWFNAGGYVGHTPVPLLNRLSDVCYLNRDEFIVSCFDFKSPVIRYHARTRTADTLLRPNDSLYYAPLAFLGAGVEKFGNRYLVPFVPVHELDAGSLYSVFDSTFTGRSGIPGFFRFAPGEPYFPYQGYCQLAPKNDRAFFVAFPHCGTVYELEMEPASAAYRVVGKTDFPFMAPIHTALITDKEQTVLMSDLIVESPYWFNVRYDASRRRLHRFHKLAQPVLDSLTRKMKKSGEAPWLWVTTDLDTDRQRARCFRANEFMFTLGYLQQQGRYLLAAAEPPRPDTHTNTIQFYEIDLEN